MNIYLNNDACTDSFLLRFGTGNDVPEDHIYTGYYSRYLLPVFVIA